MSSASGGLYLYRRLLSYALPYKWIFALAVVGMIVVAVSELSFAALLKPIMDGGFVERDQSFIQKIPYLLLIVFVARAIGEFIETYCMSWVGRRVVFDLRGEMFARLLLLPSSFYDHNSSANLVSKLIYDVEQVAQASTTAVRIFIQDTVASVALFAWLLYLSWKLTCVFLVVAPVVALVVRVASKRFRTASDRIQTTMGRIANAAKEAFQGQRVVKIFAGHEQETKQFRKLNSENRRQTMKKAAIAAASVPLIILAAGIAVAIIIYFAVSVADEDGITVGTFVSFLGAMMLLMAPIKRLAKVNEIIQTGVAASNSVFKTIDQQPEIDDGERVLESVSGKIKFENVSFRYQNDKPDVLRNIDFDIFSGQTVALVGSSGSGKTTTAALLLRFYLASQGRISIDDVAVGDINLSSLRRHISMVTQETVLFDDSIRNNIAYGQKGPVDEARLMAVSHAAHVADFVEQMPNGYDTTIGEHGVLLSGGQRQRLAIARALYKNAPILILDEATSSLDSESERLVQQATEALLKNRTTMVIAHRFSTIEKADQILVFHKGEIVERGTHAELLGLNRYYARLYESQKKPGLAEETSFA